MVTGAYLQGSEIPVVDDMLENQEKSKKGNRFDLITVIEVPDWHSSKEDATLLTPFLDIRKRNLQGSLIVRSEKHTCVLGRTILCRSWLHAQVTCVIRFANLMWT